MLNVTSNFRIADPLPSIEDQYTDLWKLAKFLQTLGLPLTEWFPPADTEANSLLNAAFTETGPSDAAIAMAKADKENFTYDFRNLGVWNGKEGKGGIAFTATYDTGIIPSFFDFSSGDIDALQDTRNIVKLAQIIVSLWKPMLIQIAPAGYLEKSVFPDRPGAGWMLYLPFKIDSQQVPEAAQVIKIMDDAGKQQLGTLLVTVEETFDVENEEHIRRANAIETRLVDQDLLPTNAQFVERF